MAKKRTKRKSDKLSPIVTVIVVIVAIALLLHDSGVITLPWLEPPTDVVDEPVDTIPVSNATVHFIDVGQGDSELIISDDGKTMLIDSGEYEYGAVVVNYIKSLGIKHLDYIFVTHPHSDHMGGMESVINSDITIGRIIIPRISDEFIPTTRAYENFLLAVADKGYKLSAAKSEQFDFGSGNISVYTTDYAGDNLNNYSAAIRYDFGNSSFLFTGDAEAEIEKKLLMQGADLDVDVYKVAHHGSRTSSSDDFLKVVTPQYCVIECGENDYGHPHSDIVDRLRDYTDMILRTDINGNVVFTTDGNIIEFEAEK